MPSAARQASLSRQFFPPPVRSPGGRVAKPSRCRGLFPLAELPQAMHRAAAKDAGSKVQLHGN